MSGADTQVQGGGDGVHIETVGGRGTLSGTVDQQAKAMGESTVMKDAEEGSNDQRVGQSWGGEARPGIDLPSDWLSLKAVLCLPSDWGFFRAGLGPLLLVSSITTCSSLHPVTTQKRKKRNTISISKKY